MKIEYRKIIHKYFKDNPEGLSLYLIHVSLVTNKALQIARKLNLSEESLVFIEEASMLHDIGCVNVNFPRMNCKGNLDYICHMTEGHKILEKEGLPKHARVASTHTGVGIYKDEIKERSLPLEPMDYLAETLEEKIISYADLFFSKRPSTLFQEKSHDKIRTNLSKFGKRHIETFDLWEREFGS